MTTIINGKTVPDNMLSFFMGVLVVKYVIDGDTTTVTLADDRRFRKDTPDPRGKWYEIKDEPLTLTDLPRPWSTDEMKPLPYEVYKDFEQGQPFKDER